MYSSLILVWNSAVEQGTKKSAAVRAKISASVRGRKVSEETREKMREAARRRKCKNVTNKTHVLAGLPKTPIDCQVGDLMFRV